MELTRDPSFNKSTEHELYFCWVSWQFYLCSAPDDIQRADEVRALVKDIWDLRLAKLRKSIDLMVTQQETFGKACTTSESGVYMCIYYPLSLPPSLHSWTISHSWKSTLSDHFSLKHLTTPTFYDHTLNAMLVTKYLILLHSDPIMFKIYVIRIAGGIVFIILVASF